MKKSSNLVDRCCEVYGVKLPEFCQANSLNESTLKTWRKKIPSYGKLLLETMIENHKLKKEIADKNKKLSAIKSHFN